uniref:Uncharacterized protein n=1 Tax=Anguilla anguilla TaxID=7936 RepID=A0A0E9R9T7_ANGAN
MNLIKVEIGPTLVLRGRNCIVFIWLFLRFWSPCFRPRCKTGHLAR